MSMDRKFSRTEMLIGEDSLERLSKAHVAVFGVGGVGGYVVEALARSGVGFITLIDNDVVSVSNINRQIVATDDTVGMLKTKAAKERVLSINKNIVVNTLEMFVLPENIDEIDFSVFDYVVDALDTVSAKIAIVEKAYKENIKVISSMGTGNKLCADKFEITDVYKTSVCPLARVMRTELKKRGIKKLKVLFSTETPVKPKNMQFSETGRAIPASISFVPSVAGLLIGGEVIKDLIK